jgi:hypothetical protein
MIGAIAVIIVIVIIIVVIHPARVVEATVRALDKALLGSVRVIPIKAVA